MGCRVIHVPLSAKGINPISDLILIIRLANLYRQLRPDFIIHYTIKPNIYGSFAAKLAGIPSIAVTTGLGYTFLSNNLVSKVAKLLYKLAFLIPNEVWFLNDDDRQAFINHRLVDKERAMILHGEGINTTHFSPMLKLKNDGRFRFLLVARMLWDKGVGDYVQAARLIRKHYPNVIFQLLGATGVHNPNAISREQIAQWEAAGDVEYLGTTNDVRHFISQADCLVLPSYYREGIPRTLMEGAAMGKPLITTDNVGCRDVVIDGETGFLCPVKDAHALAERALQILTMNEFERQSMGVAGRNFMIKNFDEQKVIDRYVETLNKYGIST